MDRSRGVRRRAHSSSDTPPALVQATPTRTTCCFSAGCPTPEPSGWEAPPPFSASQVPRMRLGLS